MPHMPSWTVWDGVSDARIGFNASYLSPSTLQIARLTENLNLQRAILAHLSFLPCVQFLDNTKVASISSPIASSRLILHLFSHTSHLIINFLDRTPSRMRTAADGRAPRIQMHMSSTIEIQMGPGTFTAHTSGDGNTTTNVYGNHTAHRTANYINCVCAG
ncbi:hypothetical protein FIBSPDRAFT_1040911 [Athelia psychrophila]|uniref:Uncharacterized protein n=1 Tax=Athelia psychrophila TaxID=1759441 RepID=A0A166PRJ1_9AGAM|nr:hypothetical protein FIBSPDRAFT_1040911 [Fibularhizoctonia sp. CBS 109695]